MLNITTLSCKRVIQYAIYSFAIIASFSSLFLQAATSTLPSVDCSGTNTYPSWTAKDWPGGQANHSASGDAMVHNDRRYLANWHTSSEPGSDVSWELQGQCLNATRTMIIDAQPAVCHTHMQTTCLRIKMQEEDNFTPFLVEVEGLKYTWGHHYELLAKALPKTKPSILSTALVSRVAEVEDDIGATYSFSKIRFLPETVTSTEGSYQFLDKPFSCAAEIDCTGLLGLLGNSNYVSLEFQYLGNGDIELINWF